MVNEASCRHMLRLLWWSHLFVWNWLWSRLVTMATNSTQVYSFPGMTSESNAICCDLCKTGVKHMVHIIDLHNCTYHRFHNSSVVYAHYPISLTNLRCMKFLRSLAMRLHYVLKYNFFATIKYVVLKALFYIWSRILRNLGKVSILGHDVDIM